MLNFHWISSYQDLHRVALRARDRVNEDLSQNRLDVLTAIMFSASTLESYMAEFTHCCKVAEKALGVEDKHGLGQELKDAHQKARSLASVLEEAEASRESCRLKYILALHLLIGKTYDKGAKPYQDFNLLFDLRNGIAHLKPEILNAKEVTFHEKLLKRIPDELLLNVNDPFSRSWVTNICTYKMAAWACNVVDEMMESIDEGIRQQNRLLADKLKTVRPIKLNLP